MRVAFIAAECEPWAKTGGLGDVVDALARALGQLRSGGDLDGPSTSTCRATGRWRPGRASPRRPLRVPDPTVADRRRRSRPDRHRSRRLPAPAHRPPAGLRPRRLLRRRQRRLPRQCLALRAPLPGRAGGHPARRRPVDVLHLHDWHACPAVLLRDRPYADDPILGPRGDPARRSTTSPITAGSRPTRLAASSVSAARRRRRRRPDADGVDLLGAGIERAELANTVSPGFAAEALDARIRDGPRRRCCGAQGDRFFGILNGIDTRVWDPATDAAIAARTRRRPGRQGRLPGATCWRAWGSIRPTAAPVLGMIGRLDPQKGFDLLAAAAPRPRGSVGGSSSRPAATRGSPSRSARWPPRARIGSP